MARKQTRRAVSLNIEVYDKVKAWCDAYKISMSSFVEERVADFFKDEFYLGSDRPKVRPTPTKKAPPTGGGYHEF